ncbi:uncharacterized protein LOC131048524 [Cryptomeria japonica]|uniref:uncharacterized protein LOC131048524 n=1 Tax=Cryptomeria japonica TaxID=3369 RepID=UPI0025AB7425|nr:uncharacterized protein LOC131048524 [Cryptomeria japonica]
MGQRASCKRFSEVCPQRVRIVDMSGQVEEFSTAVKVKQVLQNHPRHFLCFSRDLYAIKNGRLLPAEEDLRLGDIYFVLPISILDSDLSPQNLAALAARLVAAAKKEGSKHVQGSHGDSNLGHLSAGNCHLSEKLMKSCDNSELQMAFKEHLLAKSRSWQPRLHTIQETGFAR